MSSNNCQSNKEIDTKNCINDTTEKDAVKLKNDKSVNFKLLSGTKFCSYKKKNGANFPLILDQDIEFNSCKGLKVQLMGQHFSISENTETEHKFSFVKGTLYTTENDYLGLVQSLNHCQEFCVQNGTKIEVPIGTVLVSVNIKESISITVNHRIILDIIT